MNMINKGDAVAVDWVTDRLMANRPIVPDEIATRYEVHEWRNGLAILAAAHPDEWREIVEVLRGFSLLKSDILQPGGSKGLISSKLDSHFTRLGWAEKKFDTKIVVDTAEHIAPTHKVDCYKNRVALEVEWNNKDPFFDRDLNNFRLLFDLRAIDAGVIITRCTELQQVPSRIVLEFGCVASGRLALPVHAARSIC